MRVAIVYDCLYPHTVGGAERWYRVAAERLGRAHDVTFLTRHQWEGSDPGTSFRVIAVSPGGPLYTKSGRRRIWPPLRFGAGVFWHLVRHGNRYDIVHTASFPYFSLIGAWLALRLRSRRSRLIVDWFEVWGREYWLEYLGPLGGRIGYAIERICTRLPQQSFTFSRLHTSRLAGEGHRAPIVRLTGLADQHAGATPGGETSRRGERDKDPLVVFAGRHIPEKRVATIPDAIARARERWPALRCVIFGDGPEREAAAARVRELGLEDEIELPGMVPGEQVQEAIARATCLLLPSRREGYGLVVVEASACGTPALVVEGRDNAATELVEHGKNGLVVESASPELLGDALAQIIEQGEQLRRSTRAWYETHAHELSVDSSVATVERVYRQEPGAVQ